MTFGDAYIPSGSTVAVSGGGLAVERVTGNGGVIDLGKTQIPVSTSALTTISGCTITGGYTTSQGGAFKFYTITHADFKDCTFAGNSATTGGGCMSIPSNNIHLSGCSFSDTNYGGNYGRDLYIAGGGSAYLDGGNKNVDAFCYGGTLVLGGSNTIDKVTGYGGAGYVVISSGAILDLTGNTNTTPINPTGGIVFEDGVQILTGATAGTVDNTTEISGGTFTSGVIGNNTLISAFHLYGSSTIENAIVNAGDVYASSLTLSNCAIGSVPLSLVYAHVYVRGTLNISTYIYNASDNTEPVLEFMDNAVIDVTNSYNPPIGRNRPVGTVIVNSSVNFKNGDTLIPITGGTYHKCTIAKDGTITEA
jgi:hypothetical protein